MAEQSTRLRPTRMAMEPELRRSTMGCILLAVGLAGCDDDVTGFRPVEPAHVLAVLELTYRDIGKPRMMSNVAVASSVAELEQLGGAHTSATHGGPRVLTLQSTATRGDAITRFEAISTGLFDFTPPGAESRRFLHATFQVPGAFDGPSLDPAADELILVAITTANTIGDTFVRLLHREDGSAADSSLARQLQPTGRPSLDSDGNVTAEPGHVLRSLSASEVARIDMPAGVLVVRPFGFIVRVAGTQTGEPADGIVTFAFSLPLLEPHDENPTTVSVLLMAVDPG